MTTYNQFLVLKISLAISFDMFYDTHLTFRFNLFNYYKNTSNQKHIKNNNNILLRYYLLTNKYI